MSKRKITKEDVNTAYRLAAEAKSRANFSLFRARQMKDGADKIKKDYNSLLRKRKTK